MTPIAILLVLASTTIHASWNLASKRQKPTLSFFLVSNAAGALLLSPLVVVFRDQVAAIPPAVWGYLLLAGGFLTLYFWALAGAYRVADMSVIYPIARSIPVVLVAVLSHVLRQGSVLTPTAVAGMLLVVLGCGVLPLDKRRGILWRKLLGGEVFRKGLPMAFLVALGTVGYSIIDDRSLRLMYEPAGSGISKVQAGLIYAPLEAAAAAVWHAALLAIAGITGRKGVVSIAAVRKNIGVVSIFTGIAIYVSYGLVLVAMSFAANVSYVVAFRQLSIPIGAILGVVVLREPNYPLKFVGVAIVLAGLVLVSLG